VAQLGGAHGPVLGALTPRYRAVTQWRDIGQFDGSTYLFVRRGERTEAGPRSAVRSVPSPGDRVPASGPTGGGGSGG